MNEMKIIFICLTEGCGEHITKSDETEYTIVAQHDVKQTSR